MRYGVTTEATDFTEAQLNDWRVKVLKAVLFFIPRANPDTERLYPSVKAWALELSNDGLPQREVGLSESGSVLFCAPDSRNTGFWTDMAIRKFEDHELQTMSPEQFDALWNSTPR